MTDCICLTYHPKLFCPYGAFDQPFGNERSFSQYELIERILLRQTMILKIYSMVAYFCHQLSDNYVDLLDLYVVLSYLYVVFSDLFC